MGPLFTKKRKAPSPGAMVIWWDGAMVRRGVGEVVRKKDAGGEAPGAPTTPCSGTRRWQSSRITTSQDSRRAKWPHGRPRKLERTLSGSWSL